LLGVIQLLPGANRGLRPVVVVSGEVNVELRPGSGGNGLCVNAAAGLCRACARDIHREAPQQPIHRGAGGSGRDYTDRGALWFAGRGGCD